MDTTFLLAYAVVSYVHVDLCQYIVLINTKMVEGGYLCS